MNDFQHRLQHALEGTFRIDRELGGAGMSRVFVATETALERRVVVKVLPPELAAGVNVERFRREIQLAAQLQHPHIVPLLAAGDDDHLLWFSMPYIEGESLRGALTRHGRLSARDVVRILHDVVDALAYAHARGVVHRDIKPDNILTSGMHALVTDFGVAKALSAAIPVHGGTTTGMAIGTPAYMAPEQLAADPAADHRVDLYAVGLLAYELLTGSSPFTGASPQATLAAQLTRMPEPPHHTLTDVPEPLSSLIMHCLEKDADRRPQSAQALLTALEALPPMSTTAGTPTSVLRRRAVPRPRAVAVAGTMVLMAMAAWALIPRGGGRPADPAALEARDAGPGGDATTRLAPATEDSTPATDQSIGDTASGTTDPFVITRAESLAIAEAVSRRTDGSSTAVDRTQLLAEVGRIFADSMSRAIKEMETALQQSPRVARLPEATRSTAFVAPLVAPPSDGRLRVVVTAFTNATGRRELGAVARDAGNQMREAIPADRFDVVSADVTDRAARSLPDKMSVGWALRADFVVSGWIVTRGDSVSMVTMLTDVRTGRFTRATESVTTAETATTKPGLEAVQKQMGAWLDTAATLAARRRASDSVRR